MGIKRSGHTDTRKHPRDLSSKQFFDEAGEIGMADGGINRQTFLSE